MFISSAKNLETFCEGKVFGSSTAIRGSAIIVLLIFSYYLVPVGFSTDGLGISCAHFPKFPSLTYGDILCASVHWCAYSLLPRFSVILVIIVREDRTPPQKRHKAQLAHSPHDILCEGCEDQPCFQRTCPLKLCCAINPIRNTRCNSTSCPQIPWLLLLGHDVQAIDTMSRPEDIRGASFRRTKSPSNPFSSQAFAVLPRLLYSAIH